MKRVYDHQNSARQLQHEFKIEEYNQGDKSIQENNSASVILWMEYASLVFATFLTHALDAIHQIHEATG